MEYKTIKAEVVVKSAGAGRTIEGYASTFGPPKDLQNDIVGQGAFKKTLKDSGPPRKGIKLFWMHREPLGMPLKLAEDSKGLAFEAQVTKTPFGDACLAYVEDGVVDKMSIGFRRIREQRDESLDANIIKELQLFEISPVPFAANPFATIDGMKFMGDDEDERVAVWRLAERYGLVAREDGLVAPSEKKAATPFQDLPLGDREASWDAAAAEKRVRAWAGAADGPNAKYRRAFMWFDPEGQDQFGGYKLQFADVVGDELTAMPRAIFATANALQGGRGGVDLPAADKAKVKAHVERYYAKMRREFDDDGITVPWASGSSAPDDLATQVREALAIIVQVAEKLEPLLIAAAPKSKDEERGPAEATPGDEKREPAGATPEEAAAIAKLSASADRIINRLEGR